MHPLSHSYLGQNFDFEEMARGKHSITNNELVGYGDRRTVFLDTSEDDCIYFDPAWDADFSVRLNEAAKRELEGEGWGFISGQDAHGKRSCASNGCFHTSQGMRNGYSHGVMLISSSLCLCIC